MLPVSVRSASRLHCRPVLSSRCECRRQELEVLRWGASDVMGTFLVCPH